MTPPDTAATVAPLPPASTAAAPQPTTAAAATAGAAGARLWRWTAGLIVPVGAAVAWEAAVGLGLAEGRLLPPPSAILATFWVLAGSGELWMHIGATLQRVALGFGFGVVAGTVLGALTGYSGLARQLLDPSLQALRSIPSIAWVPLFILWFGIFETSKVILIAVGVFFPIYLALSGEIMNVDRKLVEVGRMFRLRPLQLVWRVLLPATLPSYLIALRAGLGLGWMFVVAAEFMGASEGLGFLLVEGQMTGRPATILASITAFAVLGKTTDWLLAASTRRLLVWQDTFGTKR